MSFLNTKTNIWTIGNVINIFTFYHKCVNYLSFWINGTPESVEGVAFIEGQLGYKIEGSKDQFYINQKGELVVSAVNVDQYEIDQNGDLTTNVDFCGNLII